MIWNPGHAVTLIAVLALCTGCGGTLTSKDNAPLIGEFDDLLDYDTPPMLVSTVRPEYPEMAKSIGVEGRVVLKVLVLEDGCLGGVEIVEAPNPILVDECVTAIRNCVFAPATKDGSPCRATLTVPFVFDRDQGSVRSKASVDADRSSYIDKTPPVKEPEKLDIPKVPSK